MTLDQQIVFLRTLNHFSSCVEPDPFDGLLYLQAIFVQNMARDDPLICGSCPCWVKVDQPFSSPKIGNYIYHYIRLYSLFSPLIFEIWTPTRDHPTSMRIALRDWIVSDSWFILIYNYIYNINTSPIVICLWTIGNIQSCASVLGFVYFMLFPTYYEMCPSSLVSLLV